jgi:AcrR family transcriptional regulator
MARARRARSDGLAVDAAPRTGAPAQGRALRARGRRTLERLLDGGGRVFAERGYHAARVDDIVKAADTSHGTFYLYFSSKEDLFRALALDVADSMLTLARELPALTPDDAGRAALREWVGRFTALYDRCGPVIRTWTEAEIVDTEFGRIGGDLVTQFTRELARRIREADAGVEAGVTAMALVAMIERSTYYVNAEQLRVSRGEMVDTLAGVMHASLYGSRLPA